MKLLFDENLSQRLVKRLEASFPGSVHVELIGLRANPDQSVWDYAGLHDLTIVSKDNDFRQMSFLKGPPPKVIWLSVGNAGTDTIARLLEKSVTEVTKFVANADESLLELDLGGL
ncbi:MAG: DUF5615 family PIN-like protein [Gammaproteobacteria bacterium]